MGSVAKSYEEGVPNKYEDMHKYLVTYEKAV
jgi:hypothetical protein